VITEKRSDIETESHMIKNDAIYRNEGSLSNKNLKQKMRLNNQTQKTDNAMDQMVNAIEK
jgi:hypothetical protein